MMINNGNNTFTGGPFDVLCILHDINTGRYHAAFFEESPLPGTMGPENLIRLKSKMHHTEGSDTLDGALIHLTELAERILVPQENIWKEPIEWNGDLGITLIRENWRQN